MDGMRIAVIAGIAVSTLVVCPAAQARKPITSQELTTVKDFRLAQNVTARTNEHHPDNAIKGEMPFLKEELGPSWSYRPIADGPQVEVGALGAGEVDAPGLVHVGMNWHF